jgi:addiction module HigA family antidote
MFNLKRTPTHPGVIFREDFMDPLGLTQVGLAARLKTTFRTINEILNGKRSISPDMAVRLAKFFGRSPEVWLNLQNEFDLYRAKERQREILREIRPIKMAE